MEDILYTICPKCNKVNEFMVSDEEYEGNCWFACTHCEADIQLQNYQQIDEDTAKLLEGEK